MNSLNRKLNELTDITDMIYDTLMKYKQLPEFPTNALTSHGISSGSGYIYMEFGNNKYHIQITKE